MRLRGRSDLILRAIETHGVTHLYLPPTVLYALLAFPGLNTTNLSSLRFFLISAASVAPEKLRTAVHSFGPVMAQAFVRCIGDGLTMKRTTGGICGVQDPSQAEQLSAFATLRL